MHLKSEHTYIPVAQTFISNFAAELSGHRKWQLSKSMLSIKVGCEVETEIKQISLRPYLIKDAIITN